MSKILIVDDNEQNLYLLQVLLGGNRHEVISTINGKEALKSGCANPPDLIISDILMPVMDGFALCRAWQNEKSLQSIPFIFYTATYTAPKDKKLALSLGAVRFIIKPEDPGRFMEIIQEVLTEFTSSTLPPPKNPSMEEKVYLKEYNERLIHKLEQKTLALEKEIAERKRTEKQLRHAQKMESIGTLAGGIAHDFNNILTTIIGFSEIAKAQLTAEDIIRQDIDNIIAAGKRAGTLVDQILTFSSQKEPQFIPFQLEEAIHEAVKLFRSTSPTRIQLQTDINVYNSLILANPSQVHQLLINLLNNAQFAIGDDRGKIHISLSEIEVIDSETIDDCPLIAAGSYLHLAIRDSGCGMDEAMQTQIFDPFFTTREKGVGTGLGLAIVHGIIKQHKGAITVSSTPGQGSTFNVYFPEITDNILP